MFSINRQCCARPLCVAKLLGIIGGAIALATNTPAIAGTVDSSTSVYLSVVETAGPIWVDYDHVGYDSYGLPSLEIYERFKDTDDEILWADVEVKVTLYHPSHDGGDNPFKDVWDDIFDKFFRGWPWGPGDGEEEIDPNYSFIPKDIVIGIDKFVKNKTDLRWENFLIQLGTGVGEDPEDDPFVPSTQDDGLYIVTDPMPKEVTSFYDELQANGNPTPDNLFWTTDGMTGGQDPWDRSIFWFGVNVPAEFFVQDYKDPDYWHAKFTIRQHVNVPEPTAGVLGLIGLGTGLLGRRRRRG